MASYSEKAQADRARQSLAAPAAVGGFRFKAGKLNRHARRFNASTKVQREASDRAKAEQSVTDAVRGA